MHTAEFVVIPRVYTSIGSPTKESPCMGGMIHEGQLHSSAMPLLDGHLLHMDIITNKQDTVPTVKGIAVVPALPPLLPCDGGMPD